MNEPNVAGPPSDSDSVAGTDPPTVVDGAVNGPATIALSATDTGSGVASTEYQVDGGGWQPYTAPFVVGDGLFKATETPGTVGGSVPATLSLTLGAPATFGAFTPGVAKEYTASTTANVISTAGDATLSVADPSSSNTGHLVNGAFALPQPLQGLGTIKTYTAPVSNDPVSLGFRQLIGANDALRTGSYSKTVTFTLSTTTP